MTLQGCNFIAQVIATPVTKAKLSKSRRHMTVVLPDGTGKCFVCGKSFPSDLMSQLADDKSAISVKMASLLAEFRTKSRAMYVQYQDGELSTTQYARLDKALKATHDKAIERVCELMRACPNR